MSETPELVDRSPVEMTFKKREEKKQLTLGNNVLWD